MKIKIKLTRVPELNMYELRMSAKDRFGEMYIIRAGLDAGIPPMRLLGLTRYMRKNMKNSLLAKTNRTWIQYTIDRFIRWLENT